MAVPGVHESPCGGEGRLRYLGVDPHRRVTHSFLKHKSLVARSINTVGILEILTLIFVVLKLTHVIAWSWWWVVSPELFSIAFGATLLIGAKIAVDNVKAGKRK
jgi:hypothetical protein